MATTRFTQLEVWKQSHQAVLDVYRLTRTFPGDERFMLVSQMRRAAVSVPANIAEGYGRRAPRDKARCYTISQGSNEELGYLLILARDLGYARDVEALSAALDAVGAMLRRLIDRTLENVDG
ncbi:MAG TPA: four helix bundle protein [Planctomycetota bacterium]